MVGIEPSSAFEQATPTMKVLTFFLLNFGEIKIKNYNFWLITFLPYIIYMTVKKYRRRYCVF